jgi:phage repressor protein C with HTH and peptisase S24 domain
MTKNEISITDLRRHNLKLWLEKNGVPQKEKSYFSQLANGTASFGERAARRLESQYHMGLNYLDTPSGTFIANNPARAIEADENFQFERAVVTSIENNNEDYPYIKRVSLKLSAGITGFGVSMDIEDKTPIVMQKEWFSKRGYIPEKLLAVTVSGQSMEPGLYDGDTVVINTADMRLSDGEVFAVNYEGELLIKRLVRDNGLWWLSSDNSDQRKYPRKQCAGDMCLIIGRIVHKQSERI